MLESAVNPEMIRIMDILYFAGGLTVVILGGIGSVAVIMGVLQMKFLKPFKNKYPYEQFNSFEEFATKRPAQPDNVSSGGVYAPDQIKKREQTAQTTPVLTWENAPEQIGSLSAKEFAGLRNNQPGQSESSDTIEEIADEIRQTEELSIAD